MKTKFTPGQKVFCVKISDIKPTYHTGVVTGMKGGVHIKVNDRTYPLVARKGPYCLGVIGLATCFYYVYSSREQWREERDKLALLDKIEKRLVTKHLNSNMDVLERIMEMLK